MDYEKIPNDIGTGDVDSEIEYSVKLLEYKWNFTPSLMVILDNISMHVKCSKL